MRRRKTRQPQTAYEVPPQIVEHFSSVMEGRVLNEADVDSFMRSAEARHDARSVQLTWDELMDCLDRLAVSSPARVRVVRKEFEWVRREAEKAGELWAQTQ